MVEKDESIQVCLEKQAWLAGNVRFKK